MAKFTAKDPISRLKALYMKAKDVYYNDPDGKLLMKDSEFDELEDIIRNREPNWSELKKTGIKDKKTKVKLTIPMPSLDKVKVDTVDRWLESRKAKNAVLSIKVDGTSLQLEYKDGKPVKLTTRGDGVIGGNVNFLIPYLKVPKQVGKSTFVVRCEGIFTRAAFQKHKSKFASLRGAANGLFNRQTEHEPIKDIDILVLKVLAPSVKPSQGLAWAHSKGFKVIPHVVVPFEKLNAEMLATTLAKRKSVSKYELDGLVIEEDSINRVTKDRPDWAKAFKANIDADSAPVTTVRKVHWEVSPRAQIIPRIQFDPVSFGGAKVQFASAFNAKYVNENGIGVGSKVAILRSGDIIPYIAKIVKKVTPSKPDVKITGAYTLDKNGTNYVLTTPKDNVEFRLQRIRKFLNTVGIEFIKIGTITKLYDLGFKNISQYVRMTPQQLMKAGISEASSNKFATAIQSVLKRGVPLPVLLDASGVFAHGMGQTRFETIGEHYDLWKLLNASADVQERSLSKIKGIGPSVMNAFIKGAPKFLKWNEIVKVNIGSSKVEKVKTKSSKLDGMGITWTGYRDKEQEQTVLENGGKIQPFGSRTSVLLVTDGGKESTKGDKARDKGIPVLTWDKFVRKYL